MNYKIVMKTTRLGLEESNITDDPNCAGSAEFPENQQRKKGLRTPTLQFRLALGEEFLLNPLNFVVVVSPNETVKFMPNDYLYLFHKKFKI